MSHNAPRCVTSQKTAAEEKRLPHALHRYIMAKDREDEHLTVLPVGDDQDVGM